MSLAHAGLVFAIPPRNEDQMTHKKEKEKIRTIRQSGKIAGLLLLATTWNRPTEGNEIKQTYIGTSHNI